MWLFSYGSNNKEQLEKRLSRRVAPVRAKAVNQARYFVGYSSRWKGGVATLIPKQGVITYGLAIEATPGMLKILDAHEGVTSGKYVRKLIDVNIDFVGKTKALIYVATSNVFRAPSEEYLEAIAKTIGEHWKASDGGEVKASHIIVRNPPSKGFEYVGEGDYAKVYSDESETYVEIIVSRVMDIHKNKSSIDMSREAMILARRMLPVTLKKFLPEIDKLRVDYGEDFNDGWHTPYEFVYGMPYYSKRYSDYALCIRPTELQEDKIMRCIRNCVLFIFGIEKFGFDLTPQNFSISDDDVMIYRDPLCIEIEDGVYAKRRFKIDWLNTPMKELEEIVGRKFVKRW